MYKNWDKPFIEVIWQTNKGTKTYKSWAQGRLACVALDVILLVLIIKWLIEWISK